MNKAVRATLIGLVAIILLLGSFSSGFVVGHTLPLFGSSPASPATISTITPQQQNATPQDLQELFTPFWESWQIVHDQYVDQPVDNLTLMRGAISGMLQSLGDQHTSYMDPQQYQDATSELAGTYDGIGAWVDTGGDYLTIISPMPDSPAEKAGLKHGDQVIAIDGQDMTGISPEVARQKVLGPAGSTLQLKILREGQSDPLDFSLTREHITFHSVEGKMLDGDIGYIQLLTFGDNTTQELRNTLKDLLAQHPKGLILDLRNNGGGYLQTAVEVGSEFVDQGAILYEQYGNGTRKAYDAIPGGLATDSKLPMVVLINEGTASASEIVSGALQDDGRAKLVGVTSYGKGSVQNWVPLQDNQGAVRVTIARWLTPDGRTIDKVGLTPDVIVELGDQSLGSADDPQLQKAVELLTQPQGPTARR
jgi:carboxyl-terminal processing protease